MSDVHAETYDREEMCDVEVVLAEPYAERESTIDELRRHGLDVTNVGRDDGVVEGTIPAIKLAELRLLESVAYVRIVFTYLAETGRSAAATAAATRSDLGPPARGRGAARP